VSVIAPPYEQWPLPWYLRTMPHVGYWIAPDDALALQAPVVVASMDHTAGLDSALGDRYVSEFFGLRPDVLLALYIERGLWERFLARAALAARGESLAAFDGRCILGGCVAPPSNTHGILGRRALPARRLARLGATPDFHHWLLGSLAPGCGDAGLPATRHCERTPTVSPWRWASAR